MTQTLRHSKYSTKSCGAPGHPYSILCSDKSTCDSLISSMSVGLLAEKKEDTILFFFFPFISSNCICVIDATPWKCRPDGEHGAASVS